MFDVDLHMHTKYSFDSLMSPKRILQVAKRKGLSAVAITDHSTIRGAVEARALRNDRDPLVIVGCEMPTERGDIIGLFLEREITAHDSVAVIEDIKAQGGVVILPHPCRGDKEVGKLLPLVDAVEAFNARSTLQENRRAQELALGAGLPVVAGSDAHWAVEIGLGRYRIEGVPDLDAVRYAILNGRGILQGRYGPSYAPALSSLVKPAKLGQFRSYPRLIYWLSIALLAAFTRRITGRHRRSG